MLSSYHKALKFVNNLIENMPLRLNFYKFLFSLLSQRYLSLTNMQVQVTCNKALKDVCKYDGVFNKIWVQYENDVFKHFIVLQGYLFKCEHLCIPYCFLRKNIIFEAHNDGHDKHFRRDKTLVIEDNFFQPEMEIDAIRFVQHCTMSYCYITFLEFRFIHSIFGN